MLKLILFLGIYSAFAAGSKLSARAKVPDKKCGEIIGCYYEVHLPHVERGLLINDIDLHLCTHVFYSSLTITEDARIDEPLTNSKYDGYKEYHDFNNIRKKNPKLKTLATMQIAAEEEDDGTVSFNNKPLLDPHLREKLVDNLVNFVKKNEFNGIDIDYSAPPQNDQSPSDKKNFVLLLKAFRERCDKEHLILSVKLDPKEPTAEILYDIKGISTYVDFINLKTYDFHREYFRDTNVGHISPLYQSAKDNAEERKKNIDYVVKYWIRKHAPPSKLILGTSPEGASYTLANPKKHCRGAPIRFDKLGQYFQTATYSTICNVIKKWTYFYDEEQQVPYIHKGDQIIAYDDVRSLKVKAKYIQDMHLGGAMVDIIDDDDYGGHCGEKFALLKALNEVLRNNC